eukprot:403347785
MGSKASQGANDWAQKRKDQIENSKKLREERKQGGSLLKNAGDLMLKTPNTSQHHRPDATSSSGFSQMNGMNNNAGGHSMGGGMMQTASTSVTGGFSGFQKYNQDSHTAASQSQYGREFGNGHHQNSNHSMMSGGVNGGGMMNHSQYNNGIGNIASPNQPQNYGRQPMGYDDLPINQMRTQENYYNPSVGGNEMGSRGQRNTQSVAQSISYDSYNNGGNNNGNGAFGQQNYTMQGFNQKPPGFNQGVQGYNQQMNSMQPSYTSTSGFNRNNSNINNNNNNAPPLSVNENRQFKSQRQPSYSREDVVAARNNLQLLKKRMGSKGPSEPRERAQSYSNANGYDNQSSNGYGDEGSDARSGPSSNVGRSNRGTSQFGHVPKPGQSSTNVANNRPASGLSQNNQDGYQNKNFRKAFNPASDNDSQGKSSGGNMHRNDSYEDLDNQFNNVNSKGINLPNSSNNQPTRYGSNSNLNGNNQKKVIQQRVSEYYPTAHSQQNQHQPPRRNLNSNNQVLQSQSQQKGGFKPSYNDENDDDNGGGFNKNNNKNSQFMSEYPDDNNNGNNNNDEEYQEVGPRMECPTCGRKFSEQALQKHAKVCKKVFVQKRKVFDTKAQRQLEDESKDEYSYKPPPSKSKQAQNNKKPVAQEDKPIKQGSKAAKWKAQSEMFRQAMRAVKGPEAGGKGGAVSYQEPQEQYDDRTECQFCGRKFNDTAAQRHIPSCEQKHKATQMKSKGPPPGKGGANMTAQQRSTSIGFRKR